FFSSCYGAPPSLHSSPTRRSSDLRGFLPHGNKRDGHAARQPIWLTAEDENPNGAQVLFLTDGATSDRVPEYQLCIELFDGNDAEDRKSTRLNSSHVKISYAVFCLK